MRAHSTKAASNLHIKRLAITNKQTKKNQFKKFCLHFKLNGSFHTDPVTILINQGYNAVLIISIVHKNFSLQQWNLGGFLSIAKSEPAEKENSDSSHIPLPGKTPKTSMFKSIIELDKRWSTYIYRKNINMGIARPILKALEISGDGVLWIPGTVALWVGLAPLPPFFKLRWLLLNLMVGFLFDLILIGFLKSLFKRARPEYNRGMYLVLSADKWSFPSGHSSRACFIGSFLWLCLEDIWVEISGYVGVGVEVVVMVVVMWSITTSTSRVLLGRHFALDVMAGACLGVLEGLIVYNWLCVSERISEDLYLWVVGNVCRQQWHQPYFPLPLASFCKAFYTNATT